MVLVNYSGKEINAKVVYYGPGLCGKTTNLEYIYSRVPQNNRGKMVSMKTRTERTLFFDFLPLSLGNLAGFQTRFLLYTVPGQVYYNATRKLVLKGVDAIIFVADSGRGKMDENVESLENLRGNLREHGIDPDELPLVMQYNKRDLPEVYTVDEMQQVLNPDGHLPWFEATATTGEGVFETFKGVARLLLAHLSKSMGITEQKGGAGADLSGAMPTPQAQVKPQGPPPSGQHQRPDSGQLQRPQPSGSGQHARPAPGRPAAPSMPSTASMPALTKGPMTNDPGLSIVRGEDSREMPTPQTQRPAPQPRPSAPQGPAPQAPPPEDGQRLLRVPVFVSKADIEAGVTIELVLRVDHSESSDDDLRRHFG